MATTLEHIDRATAIRLIKTSLQQRSGKQWSVTGHRGTAYGWITISAPPKRLGCARFHEFNHHWDVNDACDVCGQLRGSMAAPAMEECPAHVCGPRCFGSYIVPEDRRELAELLGLDYVHCQGASFSSDGGWQEYIARAAGRKPTEYQRLDWD